VFSSVNSRLLAYRADNGEKVFDLDLGTSQMGPPISFTIDGKQYIAVTGGPAGGGGRGAGATPPKPANLLVLGLDGKAPIPGVQQ
jgi:quinohemoprotein ethanol dehydrogenase